MHNWLGQGSICKWKIRLNQHMLFWLGFVTGLIQNFYAASDEKQKC
jgi:hypothetical protein